MKHDCRIYSVAEVLASLAVLKKNAHYLRQNLRTASSVFRILKNKSSWNAVKMVSRIQANARPLFFFPGMRMRRSPVGKRGVFGYG